MKTEISDKLKDGYHALMLSYASGLLDEAHNLIVSTHIAMSETGFNIVRHYESLGGSLLENECTPVEMRSNSLDSVLSQLDDRTIEVVEVAHSCFPDDLDVPSVLMQTLASQKKKPKWAHLYPGLQTFEMDLNCKESKARFLKAKPALKTPHHSHGGTEITLVLDGAFSDETGEYKIGDLIVTDESFIHQPVACPEHGCVCMVVSSTPIKLTGMARLLNPFVRI